MKEPVDYEPISKLIYGFHRSLFRLEMLCRKLEGRLGKPSVEPAELDRLDELAARGRSLLVERFGEGAAILDEFAGIIASACAHGAAVEMWTTKARKDVPGRAEAERVLSYQQQLECLEQRVDAA